LAVSRLFRTDTNYNITGNSAQHIKVEIFDIMGRKVKSLLNENQYPGSYSIHWDATDQKGTVCTTGIYFCSFTIENKKFVKKMILLR